MDRRRGQLCTVAEIVGGIGLTDLYRLLPVLPSHIVFRRPFLLGKATVPPTSLQNDLSNCEGTLSAKTFRWTTIEMHLHSLVGRTQGFPTL